MVVIVVRKSWPRDEHEKNEDRGIDQGQCRSCVTHLSFRWTSVTVEATGSSHGFNSNRVPSIVEQFIPSGLPSTSKICTVPVVV